MWFQRACLDVAVESLFGVLSVASFIG